MVLNGLEKLLSSHGYRALTIDDEMNTILDYGHRIILDGAISLPPSNEKGVLRDWAPVHRMASKS